MIPKSYAGRQKTTPKSVGKKKASPPNPFCTYIKIIHPYSALPVAGVSLYVTLSSVRTKRLHLNTFMLHHPCACFVDDHPLRLVAVDRICAIMPMVTNFYIRHAC